VPKDLSIEPEADEFDTEPTITAEEPPQPDGRPYSGVGEPVDDEDLESTEGRPYSGK
jgi:hypothetical protein